MFTNKKNIWVIERINYVPWSYCKWQCQDFNPDAKGLITKYIASVFILSYTIIPSTQKLNIAYTSEVYLLKNLWGQSLIRCPCHSSKEFLKLCKCGAEHDSAVQKDVLVALKKSTKSQCESTHCFQGQGGKRSIDEHQVSDNGWARASATLSESVPS